MHGELLVTARTAATKGRRERLHARNCREPCAPRRRLIEQSVRGGARACGRPAVVHACCVLHAACCMRVKSRGGAQRERELPEMLQALVAKKWSAPPLRPYGADERSAASAASIRVRCVVPSQSPIEYEEYS